MKHAETDLLLDRFRPDVPSPRAAQRARLALCVVLGLALLASSLAACSKEEPAEAPAAEPEAEAEAVRQPEPVRPATPAERRSPGARNPREASPAPRAETRPATKPAPSAPVEPKSAQILDKSEIRAALGYQGMLETAPLVGQRASGQYTAERLKTDKPEQFGIGLQVWRPGNAAAKRYDELFAQSWGGTVAKDVGDQSFRTEHHRLREITFLDRKRAAVAVLTCDVELCSFEQLVNLARTVQRKL